MKNFLILFLFVFIATQVSAQKDRVIGIWWNDEKTSKLEVKEENGVFSATIVYMIPEKYENGEEPKDDENPDPKLRDRSLIGLKLMDGLKYNADKNEWAGGTIYDPKSGKTYDCYVWMESDDLLKMKGYVVGIRWLGKSTEWTRTTL